MVNIERTQNSRPTTGTIIVLSCLQTHIDLTDIPATDFQGRIVTTDDSENFLSLIELLFLEFCFLVASNSMLDGQGSNTCLRRNFFEIGYIDHMLSVRRSDGGGLATLPQAGQEKNEVSDPSHPWLPLRDSV